MQNYIWIHHVLQNLLTEICSIGYFMEWNCKKNSQEEEEEGEGNDVFNNLMEIIYKQVFRTTIGFNNFHFLT